MSDLIEYTLSELGDPKVKTAERVKKSMMDFDIKSYDLPLGSLSAVRMKGMLGLMRMESLILVPFIKDMPLLSFDAVHAAGNETLILELYDTQLEKIDLSPMDAVKAKYASLPDKAKEPRWYDGLLMSPSLRKAGKKKDLPIFEELYKAWLAAYMETLAAAPECDSEEKRLKAKEYVEGLLSNGGPAVDQFKKMLGDEKAGELMRNTVFGTR